ncbi:MAG: hypothetical protein KME08_02985 [Aphanothece sp. CMT-3BRIN-NPC111]|jgi:hypothetical protein|nr:hypothetical protein [Aphanothece sp. CMT-3BRIN-NPC111]
MNQSQSQGKSKKPYVPPQLKAHGKVFQVTQAGAPNQIFFEQYGYS